MQKIIYTKHEELIPENTYLCDIDETFVCQGLCAKHIDETQYKDLTDEEAEILIEKLNKGVEEDGQEEN